MCLFKECNLEKYIYFFKYYFNLSIVIFRHLKNNVVIKILGHELIYN